jgi:hypothetical protein
MRVSHHFDVLKPGANKRLEELASDASSSNAQNLGIPDLGSQQANPHWFSKSMLRMTYTTVRKTARSTFS